MHPVPRVGGDAGQSGATAVIRGELAERIDRLTEERAAFVLATVVRARHPTSVRPGDTALVLADGTIEGFVGGDCARASVRLHALRSLETAEPLLLRLVPSDGDELDAGDADDAVVVERNPCLSGGALEIFLEPQVPALLIEIVGDSPIALALERLAAAAGYYALRGAGNEIAISPGAAAVVVASHGAEEDRILAEALSMSVPYVALVASRRRGEAVRAALDVPDELRGQLHTPAGLDIGARTPAEIAVSILAEVVVERSSNPSPVTADPPQMTAVDPVCGMAVVVVESTPWLELPDGRAFFCGEGCRRAYARQRHVTIA